MVLKRTLSFISKLNFCRDYQFFVAFKMMGILSALFISHYKFETLFSANLKVCCKALSVTVVKIVPRIQILKNPDSIWTFRKPLVI